MVSHTLKTLVIFTNVSPLVGVMLVNCHILHTTIRKAAGLQALTQNQFRWELFRQIVDRFSQPARHALTSPTIPHDLYEGDGLKKHTLVRMEDHGYKPIGPCVRCANSKKRTYREYRAYGFTPPEAKKPVRRSLFGCSVCQRHFCKEGSPHGGCFGEWHRHPSLSKVAEGVFQGSLEIPAIPVPTGD